MKGDQSVGRTHSNLNAAEVSVTLWPVCGYHTERGLSVSQLPLGGKAAPFIGWTTRRAVVT